MSVTSTTNLFLWSEQFDNALWAKSGTTVEANTQIAPDGTLTADTITASTSFGTVRQPTSVTAGSTLTSSVYVKQGTTGTVVLYLGNSGLVNSARSTFNFATSTFGSVIQGGSTTGGVTAVQDVGDGWFRLSLSAKVDDTSTVVRGDILVENGMTAHLWGAQFEESDGPTRYIKTESSQVTLYTYGLDVDDISFTEVDVGTPIFNIKRNLTVNNLNFGPYLLGHPTARPIFDLGDIDELKLRAPVLGKPKVSVSNVVLKPKSAIIDNQLPSFFDFEESKLGLFIKYYYEWMEDIGPDFYSSNILNFNDIDKKPSNYDYFTQFLHNEFLKDLPSKTEIEQRRLIKHIKDFYRSKGSDDCLKLLFRILYNDDIEISYPGEKILRASHGKWVIERSMIITLLLESTAQISEYDFIVGETSNAIAKIQRIEQRIQNDILVTELFFDSQNGTFIEGEFVKSRLTGESIAKIQELIIYPGKYSNTDGWLSSDMRLQDNYYYQEFSYVIKSGYPIENYRDFVKKLGHPAGTLFFGEYLLLIDIDNETTLTDIEKQYSKQVTYEINFFDFISLDLESEQSGGSYTGKYVITYEFNADDIAQMFGGYSYDVLTQTGQIYSSYDLRSSSNFGNVIKNDTIEVTNKVTNTTYYVKVKNKISNSEVALLKEYPYTTATNITMKHHNVDNISKAETLIYVNNEDELVHNQITISDFNDYVDLQDYEMVNIYDMLYVDLDKKVFVRSETRNFVTENIVVNSIMYIKNNINSNESYHFIRKIYEPKLMQIKDVYPNVQSNNLDYKIINV